MKNDGAKFNFHTGIYSITLFVADAFVENPVSKPLGEARLKFPASLEEQAKRHNVYEVKPAIFHQFREPEARPPVSFSWMFTMIVLSPIAILFFGVRTTKRSKRQRSS